MYRLHGFCQSGNSFKVAFALRAMRQPWEAVFVDFMNGATRDPAWREQVNEMGEAPVLDDGDRRLTQSGAILLHLARKHGLFGGRTDGEQQDVLRWLFFDNHKFTSYFATWRFMKSFVATAPDPAVAQFLKMRIDGNLAIVDKRLSSRAFVLGERPTIADISLVAYLYYPAEEFGFDIAGTHSHIAAWLDRIKALPGWKHPYELMPGYPLVL